MAIGKDLGNSILGRTETALLIVEDYRKTAREASMNEGDNQDTEKIQNAMEELEERMQKSLEHLTKRKEEVEGAVKREFSVQFNPEHLELNASAQTEESDNLTNGNKVQIREIKNTELTLSVKLIFDHVTNQDAFYGDRITPSVGSVATGLVQAGKVLAGEYNTVQTEVEGLISALSNKYTRILTFSWGDFAFHGILKSLSAEYTMFSTSGHPIRAKVDMKIQNKAGASIMEDWYQSYREAFAGGADLTTVSQAVGSFLNI